MPKNYFSKLFLKIWVIPLFQNILKFLCYILKDLENLKTAIKVIPQGEWENLEGGILKVGKVSQFLVEIVDHNFKFYFHSIQPIYVVIWR